MRFDAIDVIQAIPAHFHSDCCSGGPDHVLGVGIKHHCRAHDAAYCQRLWPAGSLDQQWRDAADRQLGVEIRSELPYCLKWIGWLYFRGTHRFGGDNAYASCGPLAGDRCRHNIERPDWML